jgi:nucleoside-diphosphate-sugar epimerase
LRTEGTEHLIAAAPGTLLVAQSFAGWPYARSGGRVKTETDALDPEPPKGIRETHAAIRRLETLTTAAGGIVLRYGGFYGPGTGMAPGGEQVEMIKKRQFPLVGNGNGLWSFLHADDLATATLAAIEKGRPGEIYNIVDDEPAPTREWLPFLAPARPRVARPDRRQPRGGGDDDRGARRLQRQGQGRAGLVAEPSELARGLRRERLRQCRRK